MATTGRSRRREPMASRPRAVALFKKLVEGRGNLPKPLDRPNCYKCVEDGEALPAHVVKHDPELGDVFLCGHHAADDPEFFTTDLFEVLSRKGPP